LKEGSGFGVIIDKDSNMFQILAAYPAAIHVFESYGMNCSGCMQVMKESLEQAAHRHGADLAGLLKDLNSLG
jgi:hybrid cluster-associated redox disulfide protein